MNRISQVDQSKFFLKELAQEQEDANMNSLIQTLSCEISIGEFRIMNQDVKIDK